MKALKYMAGVILAALALSSCQKELDIPQKGVLDMDEYYATAGPEEAESLIARVYDLYLEVPEGAQATIFVDILSDDMYAGGNSFTDNSNDYQMANNLICTSSDWAFKNVYPALYKIIYYCNLIIERIPETSDARVNRVKAEANFMRSICLFQAIRWWGTPPFADHVYASDEIYAPNGNTAEMIEWILKNLKDASEKLPALSAMGAQQEFGARVSKHAALALSPVYMTCILKCRRAPRLQYLWISCLMICMPAETRLPTIPMTIKWLTTSSVRQATGLSKMCTRHCTR